MLNFDGYSVFDPARADEFLDALPCFPAVVLIEPRCELTGARPLLLRTADLRRRLRLLLGAPDAASKRVNLRDYASAIRYRVTGSAFEQALMHWQQARAIWPRVYRERLRLRPPAVVKLTLSAAYPRAYVTRRVGERGLHFGPFATHRAADNFLEPFLDLFRLRRCQIKIRRDPNFAGCIYSEMKMCLAPCFAGCTDEEYAGEVDRIANFLRSRGASSIEELTRERESASSALDFERAASIHKRLEKVEAVQHAVPELARCVEQLNAVVLQRAAAEQTIAMFVVRGGHIADPFLLHFGNVATQPRSVEQILREVLEPGSGGPTQEMARDAQITELEDHLSLIARWFYAKSRDGEIYFEESKPVGWPYRRILRACSRLLASPVPSKAEPQA